MRPQSVCVCVWLCVCNITPMQILFAIKNSSSNSLPNIAQTHIHTHTCMPISVCVCTADKNQNQKQFINFVLLCVVFFLFLQAQKCSQSLIFFPSHNFVLLLKILHDYSGIKYYLVLVVDSGCFIVCDFFCMSICFLIESFAVAVVLNVECGVRGV